MVYILFKRRKRIAKTRVLRGMENKCDTRGREF